LGEGAGKTGNCLLATGRLTGTAIKALKRRSQNQKADGDGLFLRYRQTAASRARRHRGTAGRIHPAGMCQLRRKLRLSNLVSCRSRR
jgi:hypothetical protein